MSASSHGLFEHSSVEQRGDLLVLLVLGDHAHDDGTGAYPTVETIAKKARMTRRGAQLALRRLEALGAIEPIGKRPTRRGTSDQGQIEYRVLMGDGGELSSPRSEFAGELDDTQGRTERHEGANPASPKPSFEPSVEPSSTSLSESDDNDSVTEVVLEVIDILMAAPRLHDADADGIASAIAAHPEVDPIAIAHETAAVSTNPDWRTTNAVSAWLHIAKQNKNSAESKSTVAAASAPRDTEGDAAIEAIAFELGDELTYPQILSLARVLRDRDAEISIDSVRAEATRRRLMPTIAIDKAAA